MARQDYIREIDNNKIEFHHQVSSKDKVYAYTLMWIFKRYVLAAEQFSKNILSRKKWEIYFIHLTEKEKELLKKVFTEETDRIITYINIEERIHSFLLECLHKYPFARYSIFIPAIMVPDALLALIYRPPSNVLQGINTVHSWFDKFIPHRQRNDPNDYNFPVLYSKYFYTRITLPLRWRQTPWGKKALSESRIRNVVLRRMRNSERVTNWFDRKYRQYMMRNREKYGKERKIEALTAAYRDLIRICLGNIYLIYIALTYFQGYTDRIPLPRKLVEQPVDAINWIDPWEIVDNRYENTCAKLLGLSRKSFREITWRWAVEVNSRR